MKRILLFYLVVLMVTSCAKTIFKSFPQLEEPISISGYSIKLFNRVVFNEPKAVIDINTDSIRSYFIHDFIITIRDTDNEVSCAFRNVSILPDMDTVRNCDIIKFIGRLPDTGEIDVIMTRELNMSVDTVNLSYKLENRNILF